MLHGQATSCARHPHSWVSPSYFFCSKKNWFLNLRHVETGSNLTGAGKTGASFTRLRLGTAITSSYTRPLTASGIRVRRLANRINAVSGRPNEPTEAASDGLQCFTAGNFTGFYRISYLALRASWTTGARASDTPGLPATVVSVTLSTTLGSI